MRAGDLLRRLDSRLLPPLATGMARLGQGRLRLRVLTGAALVSVTAVLLTAVWAADRPPAGDPTVGNVVRVGVGDGQSIPGYVAAARGELAALAASTPADRPTYALVSLSAYLAPQRLAPVLKGLTVSQVYGRVQLPETQTQIVRIPAQRLPDDVTAGMAVVAVKKEAEARDYRELSRKLTGRGDQERDLRRVYDSGAAIAAAEAEAYRSGCSCVYAAVVRATPVALGRISDRPEVRAVDPAPEVTRLDRAVFLPPLPEQHDVVRPPADARVPSDPPAEPTAPPPAQTLAPEPSTAPTTAAPASAEPTPSAPVTAEPSGSAPASDPSATPT
ncbi:hypothetical protein WEI85_31130 [Actinomycetes bacterium KLBMP 9797]